MSLPLLGAGPSSGSSFTPLQVSGLLGWYKADSIAQADNTAVASWDDSSGAGNTAVQATGANQPSLQTNEINGLPVVRFDGTADQMTCNMSAASKPFTVFAVVRLTSLTASAHTILGASVNGGLQFRLNATTGAADFTQQSTAAIGTATANNAAGVAAILAGTYSGVGAYAFYKNGTAGGSGTTNVTFVAGTTIIGGRSGEYFPGDIAELLKYDSVLSAGDRTSVTAYLGTKYGIAVA